MFSAVMKHLSQNSRIPARRDQLILFSKLTESQTKTARDVDSHSQIWNWRPTEVELTQGHMAFCWQAA